MKINDWITWIYSGIPEEHDILSRKLFDVNMRLFTLNDSYRNLIVSCCNYMVGILNTEFEDYGILKGISGANIGLPFNIIAVKDNTNDLIMLNPTIHAKILPIICRSNCGSVRLQKSIEVMRYKHITVDYYDLDGKFHRKSFSYNLAYTIQHEIDHNLGIIINRKQ